MNLAQIIALSLSALLIGWLAPRNWRVACILIASLLVIYWLQPSTPIRNLDFWLPTLSVGLTVFVWASTRTVNGPVATVGAAALDSITTDRTSSVANETTIKRAVRIVSIGMSEVYSSLVFAPFGWMPRCSQARSVAFRPPVSPSLSDPCKKFQVCQPTARRRLAAGRSTLARLV